MSMTNSPWSGSSRQLVLKIAGAVLLAAAGAIHLDLYLTGYRHIPTIGLLFLLQVIAAFVLAIAVMLVRGPLAAAAGAGFAISVLGGYLLSLWIGLFGFQEVRTTAGIVAGIIDIAAFMVLALLALLAPPAGRQAAGDVPAGLGAGLARLQGRIAAGQPLAGRAVATASAAALVVLGISVATAAGAGSAGNSHLPPGASAGLTVVIKNFKFTPAAPHVRPGERIEVKNEDPFAHTLTAGTPAQVSSAFNTGSVAAGQVTFIVAPSNAGTYPFFCKLHTFMIGMLVVGHSSGNAAALASFRAAVAALPRSYCGRAHAGHPAGRLAHPAGLAGRSARQITGRPARPSRQAPSRQAPSR
jgi:plastocyanin